MKTLITRLGAAIAAFRHPIPAPALEDYRIKEAIVDIAETVFAWQTRTGRELSDDSREIVQHIVSWAEEFEALYRNVKWGEADRDYYIEVDQFAAEKIMVLAEPWLLLRSQHPSVTVSSITISGDR